MGMKIGEKNSSKFSFNHKIKIIERNFNKPNILLEQKKIKLTSKNKNFKYFTVNKKNIISIRKNLKDTTVLFTFLLFYISILRTYNYIPLNNVNLFDTIQLQNNFKGLNLTILTLGIFPIINSSLITQFLSTRINSIKILVKNNDIRGRQKIEILNKSLTILFAILSSTLLACLFWPILKNNETNLFIDYEVKLILGSLVILWISEKVNELNIGSGISLIILFNTISQIKFNLNNEILSCHKFEIYKEIIIEFIFFILAYILIALQFTERRLQIKYEKIGDKANVNYNSLTVLPLKINSSGVLGLIALYTILQLQKIDILKAFIKNHSFQVFTLSIFSVVFVTLTNFFIGIQQLKIKDLSKEFKTQNLILLKSNHISDDSKVLKINILTSSLIGSLTYYLFYTTVVIFENLFGMRLTNNLSGNLIIIISGISIDIIRKYFGEFSTINYRKIKL